MPARPVLPVLLVLLLAGCLSTAPGTTAPSAATTEPPPVQSPVAAPDPSAGLRPCLGPWTGSGSFRDLWPVGSVGPQDVPVVNITEPGVVVSVWVDSEPHYEGQAWFKPADQPYSVIADHSRTVRFNLTGDPAYGTGNLTVGAYNFTFEADHGLGPHSATWTAEIREVPRLGAPNCRPAEGTGPGGFERLHVKHAKLEEGGPSAPALPENG